MEDLMRSGSASRRCSGFTLFELMIVIAVIGILATIALPNLRNVPRRANEAALATNLRTMRDVIDQHLGDKGHYPPSLEALVSEGYLRAIPIDPLTDSDSTWVLVIATADRFRYHTRCYAESHYRNVGARSVDREKYNLFYVYFEAWI